MYATYCNNNTFNVLKKTFNGKYIITFNGTFLSLQHMYATFYDNNASNWIHFKIFNVMKNAIDGTFAL